MIWAVSMWSGSCNSSVNPCAEGHGVLFRLARTRLRISSLVGWTNFQNFDEDGEANHALLSLEKNPEAKIYVPEKFPKEKFPVSTATWTGTWT